jgi:autotransporter-associated beta strand protein
MDSPSPIVRTSENRPLPARSCLQLLNLSAPQHFSSAAKGAPRRSKSHKPTDPRLVGSLIVIALVLPTSGHGQGRLSRLISVAPEPFWSTLSLFHLEPKVSLAMLAPAFFNQTQPDYAAATGADFSALAGLSGDPKGEFAPTMLVQERTVAPVAPVNAEPGYAHKSFPTSNPSLADTWSRSAGVGSAIPAYTAGFAATRSSNLSPKVPNSPLSHPSARSIDIAPRYGGDSSIAPTYSGNAFRSQTLAKEAPLPAGSRSSTQSARVSRDQARDIFTLAPNNSALFGVVESPLPSAPNATTAMTLVWGGTASQLWTATTGTRWGTIDGTYNTNWVSGSAAIFNVANSTITGDTTSFSSITANENVTVTPNGTLGTGGTVAPIFVATGKVFDFGVQKISTTVGTGFIKNGGGVLALSAGTNAYAGGFTLNSGTVVVRGVAALGTGGALVINGGTIAANADRDLTVRYTSIAVGGNFQLGALSTAIPLSSNTANLNFNDPMNLGASTRTITIGANGTYTLGGIISGNPGVGLSVAALSGATGNVVLSGMNTYSGGTIVNSGTLKLSGVGTLGSTSGSLTVNSGTLALDGTSQTVGALNGTSSGLVKSSFGSAALTVGNGDVSGSFAGSISNIGTIAFSKIGAGTQTLTGNNGYKGLTTVNAGILQLANASGVALAGTSAVRVNGGGTLLMAGTNQINQTTLPGITLNGGKLGAGGFGQGSGGTPIIPNSGAIGLGALTLTSSSIIDLTGTSVLHFSSSSENTWTGALSIYNWSGTPITGGGAEQILFGGTSVGLSANQLMQVSFYSDGGVTQLSNTAVILADGEIVPGLTAVPEPSTWAAAVLALGALVWTQRRRFSLAFRTLASLRHA